MTATLAAPKIAGTLNLQSATAFGLPPTLGRARRSACCHAMKRWQPRNAGLSAQVCPSCVTAKVIAGPGYVAGTGFVRWTT
jgi:PHP family Zn ribbon phosphoesterase